MYTAYADDTSFFLKGKKSVKKAMSFFDTFSIYSGLKPNKSKCEINGIGVLKGESIELCGMECIDLTKKFSENLEKKCKCYQICKTRNSTVQDKITIFKTLANSKVLHLALVTNVPHVIID